MVSKKDRRHSGRTTPAITKEFSKKEIIEQGLEPQPHWNDWNNYRDGMRYNKDRTQIRSLNLPFQKDVKEQNKKLIKKKEIHKLMRKER